APPVPPATALPCSTLFRSPGLEGAEVLAPMPGAVVAVRVDTGDRVDQGDPIVVVEAMKMEHVLTAPAAGIVSVTAVEGAQETMRSEEHTSELQSRFDLVCR